MKPSPNISISNQHDPKISLDLSETEQIFANHGLSYKEVLNNIPFDIVLFSTDHKYVFVNTNAIPDVEMREWIIGKTDRDYFVRKGRDPAIAELRHQMFDKVIETGESIEWEEQIVSVEGEEKCFIRKFHPLLNNEGEIMLVIGYGFNDTERKSALDKLQLSEKRYRDLFNYSQALICTHDMEGRLIEVNPAICSVLQYTPEELIGKYLYEFIPPHRKSEFINVYLPTLAREKHLEAVFVAIDKNGDEHYLLFQNYCVEDEGKAPYVIGFSQDITARIKAEQELLVAQRFSEESAHAKELFLANMSHEIRTPMNGILGMVSLLAKTKLSDEQKNFIKLIQDSASNLLVIVNDVLDLEKIMAGKLMVEKIPFKVVDKAATIVQSFIYKAEEKGVALIYQNSVPGDLVVVGDPYRLNQVLNNILSNAVKFTAKGKIVITTRIKSYVDEIATLEFIVKDTGIGISEEKMQTIFEPFVQEDSTISRRYGGTGLGLTICKNLLEMQGGDLFVTSEKDVGSAFSFQIPYSISDELLDQNEPEAALDYSILKGRKILMAEDVELNQFIAKHMLESWGMEVSVANNGKEALDMLQIYDYDIILMDIQMPEMDGIEATKCIRRLLDEKKSLLPVIALTANALKGDSENYISIGMTDYLSKPFNEENLFKVICRNLNLEALYVQPTEMNINSKESREMAEEKLYDLSTIRAISGGDETFVQKMIDLFVETVPKDIQKFKEHLAENNWDGVSKVAHKLKSTLDSMGFSTIKQAIRTVEAKAKANESLDELPPLINHIILVVETAIEQMRNS